MMAPDPTGDDQPALWVAPPAGQPQAFDYTRYRRLLFGALATLGRRGYPIYPDEAVDLIHDFFLESWSAVVTRFDPARAKFETYLYIRFVNFARPRIVRSYRWKATMTAAFEPGNCEAFEREAEPVQEREADIEAMRWATGKLPQNGRDLLEAYLSDGGATERELAQRFQLSRHKLRINLADALGRTAVYLKQTAGLSLQDQSIVLALWRDEQSVRDVSLQLRLPAAAIQATRRRLYKRLVVAMKGSDSVAPSDSDTFDAAGDIGTMILDAFSSAAPDRFAALKRESETVMQYLESPAAERFFAAYAEHLTTDFIAAFYEALGPDGVSDGGWSEELAPFLAAAADEEAGIGRAFQSVLVPNLPNTFFTAFFADAPLVDRAERDHLRGTISVQMGGQAAEALTIYGVTPVSVVEAAQAVANIARRLCRSAGIKRGQVLTVTTSAPSAAPLPSSALSRQKAVEEIAATTHLHPVTADCLFGFLTSIAAHTPYLFDGFAVVADDALLLLERTDVTYDELYQRWRPAIWHTEHPRRSGGEPGSRPR
jgi:hypothetical protein